MKSERGFQIVRIDHRHADDYLRNIGLAIDYWGRLKFLDSTPSPRTGDVSFNPNRDGEYLLKCARSLLDSLGASSEFIIKFDRSSNISQGNQDLLMFVFGFDFFDDQGKYIDDVFLIKFQDETPRTSLTMPCLLIFFMLIIEDFMYIAPTGRRNPVFGAALDGALCYSCSSPSAESRFIQAAASGLFHGLGPFEAED